MTFPESVNIAVLLFSTASLLGAVLGIWLAVFKR